MVAVTGFREGGKGAEQPLTELDFVPKEGDIAFDQHTEGHGIVLPRPAPVHAHETATDQS
jgi:hypothetical protein